jgi:hypothetical protein
MAVNNKLFKQMRINYILLIDTQTNETGANYHYLKNYKNMSLLIPKCIFMYKN